MPCSRFRHHTDQVKHRDQRGVVSLRTGAVRGPDVLRGRAGLPLCRASSEPVAAPGDPGLQACYSYRESQAGARARRDQRCRQRSRCGDRSPRRVARMSPAEVVSGLDSSLRRLADQASRHATTQSTGESRAPHRDPCSVAPAASRRVPRRMETNTLRTGGPWLPWWVVDASLVAARNDQPPSAGEPGRRDHK